MIEEKRFLYSYRCNKCDLEFEEWLTEKNKYKPTGYFKPNDCDVYVAPHAGRPECDVVLVS